MIVSAEHYESEDLSKENTEKLAIDLKNRIKDNIDLSNKTVLDVGCGSGYHCWRMFEKKYGEDWDTPLTEPFSTGV